MSLKDQLTTDLKTAMKAQNALTLGVLRMVTSALHSKEIEVRSKGGTRDLTDQEVLAVLMNEAKKRRESVRLFREGNRPELALQEEKELAIVSKYLPKQLTPQEVEARVKVILAKADLKDFGSAMKAVMAELRGMADSKDVQEAVQKLMP